MTWNNYKDDDMFQVRLWDGWDGEWMDIGDPLLKPEAEKLCRKLNASRSGHKGKEQGSFDDGDYYEIFPAGTRMQFAEGRSQTRGTN